MSNVSVLRRQPNGLANGHKMFKKKRVGRPFEYVSKEVAFLCLLEDVLKDVPVELDLLCIASCRLHALRI